MTLIAKKTSMNLFMDSTDHYCHRVRIVVAEKNLPINECNALQHENSKVIAEVNPYGKTPTLIDRDLVLYDSLIIMEYLDERFPHPPLLPIYPVNRAQVRLMIYRIQNDWCTLVDNILHAKSETAANQNRKKLKDSLISSSDVFSLFPYFMSEDFTLADCCVIPLLWRLPSLGISLPTKCKPIFNYYDRLMSRPSVKMSLTETELEMRTATEEMI